MNGCTAQGQDWKYVQKTANLQRKNNQEIWRTIPKDHFKNDSRVCWKRNKNGCGSWLLQKTFESWKGKMVNGLVSLVLIRRFSTLPKHSKRFIHIQARFPILFYHSHRSTFTLMDAMTMRKWVGLFKNKRLNVILTPWVLTLPCIISCLNITGVFVLYLRS